MTRQLLVSFCDRDAQCLHGGVCQQSQLPNSKLVVRHCECPENIGGSRCEHFCPLRCQHGGYCRHINVSSLHQQEDTNPDNYECKCHGHLTGKECEIPYENCGKGIQCWNGGSCRPDTYCDCPEGYGGRQCEILGGPQVLRPVETVEQPLRVGAIVICILGLFLLLTTTFMYRRWRRNRHTAEPKRYNEVELEPIVRNII